MLAERNATIADQATEIAALTTKNSVLTTEGAALTTEVAALKIANAPAPHTNDSISTIDFKRRFVGFVHIEMLLVLREVCEEWNEVVIECIDERVDSGVMVVHGGNDISYISYEVNKARQGRRHDVTQVIFLLNITKVTISISSTQTFKN
ncbi:hypothetical protein TL16_g00708 [Triparma laevis f. inornata]|nr:hypothetical protein TL16_g00708 [Triparma laevis f. inornata]GMI01938.1 hypothetical protein TrLO_g8136 [Triparma laevis f. longispina]